MEEILKSGRAFRQFETDYQCEIFKDAEKLPQFLEMNLLDDARVVKQFINDPQANIRVFYYQYLKLCFESSSFEVYTKKIKQFILNPEFNFLFCQEDDPQLFNDNQFKRIIIEFFDYMAQSEASMHQTLNKYPILDIVLIYFFRTLLILTQKTTSFDSYIDKEILFDFLTSQFGVEASVHQNCLKFEETDIFVYEDSPENVFMIYINYEEGLPIQFSEPLSSQLSGEPNIEQVQPLKISNLELNDNSPQKKVQLQVNTEQGIQNKGNLGLVDSVEKRRLQKLTYLGNSQIYDFVDYTNPKSKQNDIKLGENKPISKVSEGLPIIPQKQDQKVPIQVETPFFNKILQSKYDWKLVTSTHEKTQLKDYSQVFSKNNSSIHQKKSTAFQDSSILLYQSKQRSKPQISEVNIKNNCEFNLQSDYSFSTSNQGYNIQAINQQKQPTIKESLNLKNQLPKKYELFDSNYLEKTITTNKYTQNLSYSSKDNLYSNNLIENSSKHRIVDLDYKTMSKFSQNRETSGNMNVTVGYQPQNAKRTKNISEEMTNSFTLQKVIEPHRTNIKAMKVRARANRIPVGAYVV